MTLAFSVIYRRQRTHAQYVLFSYTDNTEQGQIGNGSQQLQDQNDREEC
jgi:hypothetical protein